MRKQTGFTSKQEVELKYEINLLHFFKYVFFDIVLCLVVYGRFWRFNGVIERDVIMVYPGQLKSNYCPLSILLTRLDDFPFLAMLNFFGLCDLISRREGVCRFVLKDPNDV